MKQKLPIEQEKKEAKTIICVSVIGAVIFICASLILSM